MPRLDVPPLYTSMLERGALVRSWARWFSAVFQLLTKVQNHEACYSDELNADLADQSFFIANQPYEVVAIQLLHSVAGSDGSAVNAQVTKDVSTEAPGAGKDLLTNNSDAGFNLKATANTVQEGTLSLEAADRKLSKGDRLSVDFAGTLTSVAGVQITVSLKPL